MILSNYWKWLNGALTYNTESSEYYDPSQNVGLVDINGETGYLSYSSSNGDRRYANRNINNGSVRLGSGDAEVTVNDYAMSNDCTSSISSLSYTINSAGTDEGLSRTITITGINSSGNAMTITEAGYCKYVSSEENGDHYVLVVKTKLNTPLTVQPNSAFKIDITWNEA